MNSSIAIDGPAGSGKSTITELVSRRLGLFHVDSGAFYRTITYYLIEQGIDFNDEIKVLNAINCDLLEVIPGDGVFKILLNGKDVSDKIRTREITKAVSPVSAIGCVRDKVNKIFRRLSSEYNIIMEGRDIGTIVLPNAEHKFYLNASVDERAKRRRLELLEKGEEFTFEEIRLDIQNRDHYDSTRKIAPLKKAADADEIDTTSMSVEEVVEDIVGRIKKSE
ncbi:MAG: (d)CMP kinase [Candidatus Muirbacterium halophilum]|nr:(d)CMP kinase [Candidatus Muirbacterium halophilum]MCK9474850.1 (d)CMP kinase [Candidatus Muirbacterium halophilum]